MKKILIDKFTLTEYEVEYIDSTHVVFGGAIWHIGQLVESPFYEEIIEFIRECRLELEQ